MRTRTAFALGGAMIASSAIAAEPPVRAQQAVVQAKTYYETSEFRDCGAETSCQIYFPRLADSAVLFRRVSCVASHTEPVLLSAFGQVRNKSDRNLTRYATLSIPTAVKGGGGFYSQFNQEVFFRLKKGDMPSVLIVSPQSTAVTLSCVASGTPD